MTRSPNLLSKLMRRLLVPKSFHRGQRICDLADNCFVSSKGLRGRDTLFFDQPASGQTLREIRSLMRLLLTWKCHHGEDFSNRKGVAKHSFYHSVDVGIFFKCIINCNFFSHFEITYECRVIAQQSLTYDFIWTPQKLPRFNELK